MKLNYYELRNTKRHILFHAPKTICSDVITTHTEMRYCCCILSPQTIYTLSQFFHLSLENDVTATLKRFLKPFLLTFIPKWILIQFCPKKSRSKNNKWHPQSVNTGFHIILRQVFRLAIKTITGKHFSCNMGQSWQFRRITLSKQKSVWGHCEDCCKPPIFFKKPFSDNSITIFQNYLYLNGVVSWCCRSPNDVTFSLLSTFTNTHLGKRMQNFCRFVSTDKFTDKFWLN